MFLASIERDVMKDNNREYIEKQRKLISYSWLTRKMLKSAREIIKNCRFFSLPSPSFCIFSSKMFTCDAICVEFIGFNFYIFGLGQTWIQSVLNSKFYLTMYREEMVPSVLAIFADLCQALMVATCWYGTSQEREQWICFQSLFLWWQQDIFYWIISFLFLFR